jgi:hypothetical protein
MANTDEPTPRGKNGPSRAAKGAGKWRAFCPAVPTTSREAISPHAESPSHFDDTSATAPFSWPRLTRLSSKSPYDAKPSAATGESALQSLRRKGKPRFSCRCPSPRLHPLSGFQESAAALDQQSHAAPGQASHQQSWSLQISRKSMSVNVELRETCCFPPPFPCGFAIGGGVAPPWLPLIPCHPAMSPGLSR